MKPPFLDKRMLKLNDESWNRTIFGLLILWCALPVFIAGCCLVFGMTDGVTLVSEYVASGPNYNRTLNFYRESFLILGGVTLAFTVVLLLHNRVKPGSMKSTPWLWLLLAMLFWATLSALNGDNPAQHLLGSSYRCDGLLSYCIYAAVFCCALSLQDETKRGWLLRIFAHSADPLSAVMLLEVAEVFPFRQCFQAGGASIFNQFNHFSYYLCMTILCLFGLYLHSKRKSERVIHLLSLSFQIYALLANGSLGGWLAVAIGMIAALIFWHASGRKLHPAHFIPVAIFTLFSVTTSLGFCAMRTAANPGNLGSDLITLFNDIISPSVHSGTDRGGLWAEAIKRIPLRPLFGYGPEGLTGEYKMLVRSDRPHCEPLQHAVFLGIPALALYLSALITLTVRQWRHIQVLPVTTLIAAGSTVAYLCSAMVGNTMFNTAPYFWLLLGLSAQVIAEEQSDATVKVPYKYWWATAVGAITLILILSVNAFQRHVERAMELSDISCLQLAHSLGLFTYEQGMTGEYWLNDAEYCLTLVSDQEPQPCGMGNALDGHAAYDSTIYLEDTYEYDGSLDYRDAWLRVLITQDENEPVHLEWVKMETPSPA